jgi:hypothetical protein
MPIITSEVTTFGIPRYLHSTKPGI